MKKPFATKEKLEEIASVYPTPFHLYDERGIRENAREIYDAFSWNKGLRNILRLKLRRIPSCSGFSGSSAAGQTVLP